MDLAAGNIQCPIANNLEIIVICLILMPGDANIYLKRACKNTMT